MRGGITIDLEWSDGKPSQAVISTADSFPERQVNVMYGGTVVKQISTGTAQSVTLSDF